MRWATDVCVRYVEEELGIGNWDWDGPFLACTKCVLGPRSGRTFSFPSFLGSNSNPKLDYLGRIIVKE